VVEHDDAVGEHERVVVGERAHARAELDVAGPLGRGRDEHLRRGDQLRTGRVVLADPGLVEAQPVEELDEGEVPVEGDRRVETELVDRRQEDAEAQR
jgi:hypothetical protein